MSSQREQMSATTPTKHELRNILGNLDQNLGLCSAAVALFGDLEALERLKAKNLTVGPHTLAGATVVAMLLNPPARWQAIGEFVALFSRVAVRDGFEAIRVYCQASDQEALLRAQPWYQFARLLRNSLSHDNKIHYRPSDHRDLPATWNGCTLDVAQDGRWWTEIVPHPAWMMEFFGVLCTFADDELV